MARIRLLPLPVLAALLFAGAAPAETHLISRISILQPATWDSPIVPRTSAGSQPTDNLTTAPLLSPMSPVWLNWAVSTNQAWNGPWVDELLLDGVPYQLLPRRKQGFVAQDWFAMDAGPFYVRGGRHTVELHAEITDHLEDYSFRYDNESYRQLLWTPEPLPATPGLTVSPAGPPMMFSAGAGLANNHAYALATPARPWAVALSSPEDFDLTLFDDFTSSTSGLSHTLASSARRLDSLDVIVSGGAGLPAMVYPAVTRKAVGSDNIYFLESNDTAGHLDTDGDAFWGAESLYRFVNLYQIDLQAGVTYPMSLWTRVGPYPIHFAVFPSSPTFVGSLAQALVRSQPVAGQDYEVAAFTPAAAGRYLILAFRDQISDQPQRYQLAVGSQAVGVGIGPADGLGLEASPNPSRVQAQISYTLAQATRVKLDVLDLQGRLVTTVFEGQRPAGPQVEHWDLRGAAGEPAAPGLYWVRLDLGGRRLLTRLSVIH